MLIGRPLFLFINIKNVIDQSDKIRALCAEEDNINTLIISEKSPNIIIQI
jgi:hypothetical protein